MKLCNKCKKLLPLADFPNGKRNHDGIRSECKKCQADVQSAWYQANKEDLKTKQAAYRVANRETVNAKQRAYGKAHPAQINANTIKRKAAKLQRTPRWLTQLHLSNMEMFYDAAHKLTEELGIPMHVDHIVPLQGDNVSGMHVPWNLQVIPATDNIRKSNKLQETQ